MSLISQDCSFQVQGSRPDWEELFYSASLLFRIVIDPIPVYFDFIQNFSLLSLRWARKAAVRPSFEPSFLEIASFGPKLSPKEDSGI